MNGEIVSVYRLFHSRLLLFQRKAQVLTARQGISLHRGLSRATAKPQKASYVGAIHWLVWTGGDLVLMTTARPIYRWSLLFGR
jgi:hypothetical protein